VTSVGILSVGVEEVLCVESVEVLSGSAPPSFLVLPGSNSRCPCAVRRSVFAPFFPAVIPAPGTAVVLSEAGRLTWANVWPEPEVGVDDSRVASTVCMWPKPGVGVGNPRVASTVCVWPKPEVGVGNPRAASTVCIVDFSGVIAANFPVAIAGVIAANFPAAISSSAASARARHSREDCVLELDFSEFALDALLDAALEALRIDRAVAASAAAAAATAAADSWSDISAIFARSAIRSCCISATICISCAICAASAIL
jgi:hypothetical protein